MFSKFFTCYLLLIISLVSHGAEIKLTTDLRYSKGIFNIDSNSLNYQLNKTHNNASRTALIFNQKIRKTSFKYIYVSGLNLGGTGDVTSKFISAYSISNLNFGTITYGKLTPSYKATGKNIDPFYDTAAGTTNAGNNFGLSPLTRGFTRRTISYTSPSIDNIRFNIGYSGAVGKGDQHLGLEYTGRNMLFGVQYLNTGDEAYVANMDQNDKAIRLYFQKFKNSWEFGSSIERINHEGSTKSYYLNFSAKHYLEGIGYFSFSYGRVDNSQFNLIDSQPYFGDGVGYSSGFFYKIGNDFELYILGSHLDLENSYEQNSIVLGVSKRISL